MLGMSPEVLAVVLRLMKADEMVEVEFLQLVTNLSTTRCQTY